MALTRAALRNKAAHAAYEAGKRKPPTRAQAKAWLAPIRNAFLELRSGEIDAYRGYAITRIHWADTDFARVDHCINGFVAMLARLNPEFDCSSLSRVSKKLEIGVLLKHSEIDQCFTLMNRCEDLLLTFTREQLKAAALTEQVNIELERTGLK